ncbi:hypothetical protein [Aureimonas sp. AU4]|uniref:hypothetical protein n=1 Tax=Aureimonas sp. AU4 TaxID=1638163 RepID=UPI000AC202E5|nr:hypothetical protein [Aureimonas sp. AU4]
MPRDEMSNRAPRTAARSLALATALVSLPAEASCLAVLPPACSAREAEFAEQFEIDNCRTEMAAFQTATTALADCLEATANEAIATANRATDTYNLTVRAFNERLQRSRAVRKAD